MTLIIGNRCTDGVIVAADRRGLRGYEPHEQTKILQTELMVNQQKALVLLAGAGISSFWDEASYQLIHSPGIDVTQIKTLIDVVDCLSSVSINMSARYQHDGLNEPLGCVVAGLTNVTSGIATFYYFAGAGFSPTKFMCLGSGDKYALPLADALLNTHDISIEQAVQIIPLIFALVERVNLSVHGGPDVFIIKDGGQAVQVEKGKVEEIKRRALTFLERIPGEILKIT